MRKGVPGQKVWRQLIQEITNYTYAHCPGIILAHSGERERRELDCNKGTYGGKINGVCAHKLSSCERRGLILYVDSKLWNKGKPNCGHFKRGNTGRTKKKEGHRGSFVH